MENDQILEGVNGSQAPIVQHSKEGSSSHPKITSFFSLLETSINDWWMNLRKFAEIYLWGIYYALIPLAIIMLLAFFWDKITNLGSIVTMLVILVAIVSGAVALYFFIQAYVGLFVFVKKNFQGSAKESFEEAKPYIVSYFILSLLTSILVLLWSLLLIIPGIIFSFYYALAAYVLFIEDKKGMAAIKRSKQLVKNYWWPVAGRIAGVSFVTWIFMMIISIPAMSVAENSWFWHLWNMVVQIVSYLIGPMVLIFSYKIYQDLVNIKK